MNQTRRLMDDWKEEAKKFRPWLIQRLARVSDDGKPPIELSAIGENDSLKKCRQWAFSYDYMGSSEFEWGALPKAMRGFYERAQKGEIVEITSDVRFHHVINLWNEGEKTEILASKDRPVYILAPKDRSDDVEMFVHMLADGREPIRLKELTHFDAAALRTDLTKKKIELGEDAIYIYIPGEDLGGWFCIDEGREFFFFIDKDMFERTKILFGLDQTPKPTVSATPQPDAPKPGA